MTAPGDRRHRLLYLGHNLPYPPDEGALIRSYHTVRLLSREYDLTGVYFWRRNARGSSGDRAVSIAELERFGAVEAFPIPQEHSRVRFAWDHLRSVVTRTPYTRWIHESRAVRRTLSRLTDERAFDLVHVDSLDLLAYLPALPPVPLVLAHHNVESSLLERRAEHAGPLARAYLRHQAELLRRAEARWCSRADLNIAVSAQDAAEFERIAPCAPFLVLPNGVDTRAFRPMPARAGGGVVFVGGYSWLPNSDGMRYFAREVLPLVRRERPDVRVRWIGKAPATAVEEFAALGVEMLGYVPDIRSVLGEAECVIVPLRIGGGTRLKILDAWAMGKAVVSTSVGSEGLETRRDENILIADSSADFADATLRVLRQPALRRRLETGGRDTAERLYDWERLGDRMLERYRSLEPGRDRTR